MLQQGLDTHCTNSQMKTGLKLQFRDLNIISVHGLNGKINTLAFNKLNYTLKQ